MRVDESAGNAAGKRQAWLNEFLKPDSVEAAALIGDALAATNRVAVSGTRRLELAEKYYTTAVMLWPSLERQFTRASHPLSGDALAAAKAALTLSTELGIAYKHLLAHEAQRRLVLSGNRLLVALIHRCLQCTARILLNSYMSYAPVPPRTWHDAHAVFMFAHQRNLQQTPTGSDNPEATPERLYVHALLVALANPYGFLPGQLGQVVQYLQEHSHWARLTDVAPVHRLAKAVAVVPVGHDFPPFSANKGGNAEGNKLHLLTYDLASRDPGAVACARGGAASGKRGQGSGRQDRVHRPAPPIAAAMGDSAGAPAFNRLASRARVSDARVSPPAWQYSRGHACRGCVDASSGCRR
jgi:hypothetical protein